MPLPDFDLSTEACMSFGKAAIKVPSTSVNVNSISFKRELQASGLSSSPNSAMISFSRWASKTVADSDS